MVMTLLSVSLQTQYIQQPVPLGYLTGTLLLLPSAILHFLLPSLISTKGITEHSLRHPSQKLCDASLSISPDPFSHQISQIGLS